MIRTKDTGLLPAGKEDVRMEKKQGGPAKAVFSFWGERRSKAKFATTRVRLDLFDGGAAGGEGAGTAGGSETGENKAGPAAAGRGKTGEKVLYGKQTAESGGEVKPEGTGEETLSDAGRAKDKPGEVITTSDTLEERRKRYRELVNGEFKDLYTEDTQRIIDRRFKETKGLEERLGKSQPIIDMLMDRYGIADGDTAKLQKALDEDNALWEKAADEAGMSVEQYKKVQKLQRDNKALLAEREKRRTREAVDRQTRQWVQEAQELQGLYPHFDLGTEMQSRQFMSMLRSGVPVRTAYEVLHMEEIKQAVEQSAARAAEKQVVDGIRAKGLRPAENGTAAQSGFTVKDDVSKLSRKDRAEIARRVARGEKIVF